MDASILLVGSHTFLNIWSEPIEGDSTYTLEVAPDPQEAMPLIQAQQPDILIVEASQPDALELCRQMKAQSRLAWIYCILLDQRYKQGGESWLGTQQQELECNALALDAGADAYLWLPMLKPSGETGNQNLFDLYHRLVQCQIQAGLRRLQNHRELMRTNDLLSAIALTDPLTELNNRRAFEWELPRQIQSARHRQVPISLIMLDVDFFKTINDTYGHLVGDRALQLLSARLRHNLRFYDTPFRYGGEEFVIILRDTNCQEASMIAHRICRLISDQPFTINSSLDLTITISAGAASLIPEDDGRGNSLLYRADQNLLKAKLQGRNQVVPCDGTIDCPHTSCPNR